MAFHHDPDHDGEGQTFSLRMEHVTIGFMILMGTFMVAAKWIFGMPIN